MTVGAASHWTEIGMSMLFLVKDSETYLFAGGKALRRVRLYLPVSERRAWFLRG
jgi:hypothetical protein